ncbi:MAG: ABC transporter permease, partial [Candidatus Eremiobacteraeota bacterium]|nr:ABC transporter permease [Candidatus Eremiobacteraeota bacterium]
MTRFIATRAIRLIAVLVAITLFSFLFLNLIPGDPATVRLGEHATPEQVAALRAQFGLDKPWYVQFGIYLEHVAHGDLGRSIDDQEPVAGKLAQYFPATVELAFGAILFSMIVGIPAGIAAAVWRGTSLDALTMVAVLLGVSIPVFWLGWMLV